MTRKEFYEDCEQAEKESTTKRENITIQVSYSGGVEYEYENCTLDEALEMAEEDFRSERLSHRDVSIDEIVEV